MPGNWGRWSTKATGRKKSQHFSVRSVRNPVFQKTAQPLPYPLFPHQKTQLPYSYITECLLCRSSIPKPLFSPRLSSEAIFQVLCAQLCVPEANMIQHRQWRVQFIYTRRYYTALHVASNCHSSCIIRGRRLRKLKMHSVPTDNSQMRLAIVSLNSLKNSSSYKSPLTSYPRSLARTIYTCSASCCFCKGNPCIPHS